jgi:hypothetical protein
MISSASPLAPIIEAIDNHRHHDALACHDDAKCERQLDQKKDRHASRAEHRPCFVPDFADTDSILRQRFKILAAPFRLGA